MLAVWILCGSEESYACTCKLFSFSLIQMLYMVWILLMNLYLLTCAHSNGMLHKINECLCFTDNRCLMAPMSLLDCLVCHYNSVYRGSEKRFVVKTFCVLIHAEVSKQQQLQQSWLSGLYVRQSNQYFVLSLMGGLVLLVHVACFQYFGPQPSLTSQNYRDSYVQKSDSTKNTPPTVKLQL